MFKVILLIAIGVAACYGAPSTPGTYCGEAPNNLFQCLTAPLLIGAEASKKCNSTPTECDRIKCLFREMKWMEGDVVDKEKFSAFLNTIAKNRPEWTSALDHAKTDCLDQSLKPQGIYLDCPTFDITHCVYTSFIRFSPSSQWSNEESCNNARQYAHSCPVCPTECFAPSIPIGSCNACVQPNVHETNVHDNE